MSNSCIDFIKYIFKQIKHFWRNEIVSLFLTICFSISVVVTPYCMRYLIDLFSKNKSFYDVWFVMFAFLLACFLQPIFSFLNIKITKKISEELILKIRYNVFSSILKSPYSFFCENSSGTIISRLINDSNQLGSFLSNVVIVVFQNVLFLILILIGMFMLSAEIAISLCILLLLYGIFNIFWSKNIEKKSSEILKNSDHFYKIIKECIDNMEEIKVTRCEENTLKIFLNSIQNLYNSKIKFYNFRNIVDCVNGSLEIFSIALIYLVGFYFVSKDRLTVGSVVAFDVYFQMIIPSVRQLLAFNSDYNEVKPALLRLIEYFNIGPEQEIISHSVVANVPSILFNNVTFKYSNDLNNRVILSSFSTEFNSEGIYGIIGESGVGKSTIARLIVGLYYPTSGDIAVSFGRKNLNVRDNVGYASQNMKLFYGATVIYNITLGNKCISNEQVYAICEKLNLHKKILKLNNGYEEVVNEKINFSGGEVQRIILARVYLQKKPINVFDEITSALDFDNALIAKDVIEDLSKNSLIVLITHDTKLLDSAKQVIKL